MKNKVIKWILFYKICVQQKQFQNHLNGSKEFTNILIALMA